MQQSPDVGISIAHPGTRGQRFEAMFPKTSQFLNKESPASPSILHDFPGIIVNFFHLCYEDFFLTVSGRHDKMDPLSTKCKCVDGEKTIFFCVQRAAGWFKAGAEGLGYWPLSGRAEQTVGSDGCPPLPGQRFAAKSRSCKVAVSTKVQQREWYHGCPVVGTLQALVSQGFRLERREPFLVQKSVRSIRRTKR